MTLGPGDHIGPYRILRNFEAGANCRWTIGEREREEYFVKEFQQPKYPPELIKGELRKLKLQRCKVFEDRHKSLVLALSRVCAPGGNIVMPTDFLRLNLCYYHIAPRIDTATLTCAQIAALPARERLVLLRLLARSLMTLHSQRIVHGDLKPSNILINRAAAGLAPKLIDFDRSFFAGMPPEREEMSFDQNYMAPEILSYNQLNAGKADLRPERLGTSADIFSCGILIHEYWTGRRPGIPAGFTHPAEAVAAGKTLGINLPDLDAPVQDLVRAAILADPSKRPSIEAIDRAIAAALTAHRDKAAKPAPPPAISTRFSPPMALPISGFAEKPKDFGVSGPSGVKIRLSRDLKGDER